MRHYKKSQKMVSLILIITILSSCSSLKTVSAENTNFAAYLVRGEQIIVTLKSGAVETMIVGKVTKDELIGSRLTESYDRIALPLADITEISAKRTHTGRTTFGVIGLSLLASLMVLSFASLSGVL